MKCFLSLFVLIVTSVHSLNILGIFPYEGKSHFFVFEVLMRELAERGHNVTVVTYFPQPNPIKNYNEVILTTEKTEPGSMTIKHSYLDLLKVGMFIAATGYSNCEDMLKHENVQRLTKQNFDVVLVERFNTDCGYGLAYKVGAPVVGLTSHVVMPFHYPSSGIPYNPAYVPFHFLGGGTKPTLLQRVERVALDFYFKSLYYVVTQLNQFSLAKHLGDDIPSLSELTRQTKFFLLYHNFVLTGSRAFPSNAIEVGGYHVGKPKPLPKDLKAFMDGAKDGVIFISFGTNVKSSSMPSDQKKAILETIAKLPYKFVWKWDDESFTYDKSKLFIGKWMPQVDILAHPNTVAFVSHAGLLSTTEAIQFSVPLIAMPIFGDQPSNAAAIEESGAGVQVPVDGVKTEDLLQAFKTVLSPEFRARAKLLSKAWSDRPLSPMDTAVYWIEYAARYPELNFSSPQAFVPWYQQLNLDVIAVFTAILALIYFVIKNLLGFCKKSKTVDPNKKIKRN